VSSQSGSGGELAHAAPPGDNVASFCDAPRVDADPLPAVPCGACECVEHVSSAVMPWRFFVKFELLIDRLLDKLDVTNQLQSETKAEVAEMQVHRTLVLNEVADETKHKDFCTDEFLANQLPSESKEPEKQDLKDKIEGLEFTLETIKAEVAKVQVHLKRAGEDHKGLLKQVVDTTRSIVLESSNSISEKIAVLHEASQTQFFEALCSRDAALGAPPDSLPPTSSAGSVNMEGMAIVDLCSPAPLPATTTSSDKNEPSDSQEPGDTGFITKGTSVQLDGLVSTPLLNGCLGCVAGFDVIKDRFAVAVKGAGTNLFRLANLKIECPVCDEFSEPGELCVCSFGASSFQQSRFLDRPPTSFVQETSFGSCSAAGFEPAKVECNVKA